MLKYCLKCKKDTEKVDSNMLKTKNGRPFSSSKCTVCVSKKSNVIKEQETKGLLSSLGLKTPLSKVSLIVIFCLKYKMNEIVNKFVVVGDKFMPKIHLKQPGFTYSTFGTFTKNKERIEKIYANSKYRIYLQK